MSKHMQMTDDYRTGLKNKYILEFSELLDKYLAGRELPEGKLSFIRNLPGINKKAIVYFNSVAWSKMIAVINEFDKEVAWHGLVRKLDPEDDKQAYLIYDIVVYPQEVTGATVNTDQKEYEKWLDSFSDDDFNAIKMQGHSHVNMSVSPSSVDNGHKESIIRQLDGDMYYIFMIWNKRFQHHITIYDFGDNVAYEDGDVEVKLYDSNGGLDAFIANAKTLVKTKTFSSYSSPNSKVETKAQKDDKVKSLSEPKKDSETAKDKPVKNEDKPRVKHDSFRKSSTYGYGWDDDDYDDPYSAFGYCRGGMYGY